MNENKGIMPTKVELTLEQSQQGVSDDVLHGEYNTLVLEDPTLQAGYPVKEVLPKLNLHDHRYKHQCCSLIPAKSDSLPHAHTQALYVIHSASRLLVLNKNIFKVKQRSVLWEIDCLRSILWEIVSLDEEEEFSSFQDEYEYVSQKHMMIKKVKIKMIQDKEMIQDSRSQELKVKRQRLKIKITEA
ncbi:hypothetical protein Tco_1419655 [Tanacetum coccineum]